MVRRMRLSPPTAAVRTALAGLACTAAATVLRLLHGRSSTLLQVLEASISDPLSILRWLLPGSPTPRELDARPCKGLVVWQYAGDKRARCCVHDVVVVMGKRSTPVLTMNLNATKK